MIDEHGLSVLPITSLGLDYAVGKERISSGIPRLDTMLGGEGYYRGSSILVSGSAGTGKTSLAATFADAACRRGERCLYVAYEESPRQIVRNMASMGLDLGRWERKGLLAFRAARSTLYGLEQHLVTIHKFVEEFRPAVVVVDPITTMRSIGDEGEIQIMLTRVVDLLKRKGITGLFTSLSDTDLKEHGGAGISSLMDTWIVMRNVESGNERNRLLSILKSRGMAHSNQMREFVLTDRGIQLTDVYAGQGVVLTGSARMIQEAKDRAQEIVERDEAALRRRELEQAQRRLQAQVSDLMAQSELLEEERDILKEREKARADTNATDRERIARVRGADE
jgi:circadian clock protein KaiC